MALTIKKKVSLDFLGEDYTDAYLTFKAIPVLEYEKLQDKIKGFESKPDGSVTFMLDLLKKHFIDGQSPDESGAFEAVSAEDLDNLDPATMIECFRAFTGQELDPKGETPLTNTSTMAETPQ